MPCSRPRVESKVTKTGGTRQKGGGGAGALAARARGLRPAARGRRRRLPPLRLRPVLDRQPLARDRRRRATPPSPRPNRSASRTGKKSCGVLTLVVEGAHAPMMQHVAPAIVERVNRFFGYPAVERVAFRQGMVQAARAKPRPAPPSLAADPGRAGRIRCAKWPIRSCAPVWNCLRAAFPPAMGRRW